VCWSLLDRAIKLDRWRQPWKFRRRWTEVRDMIAARVRSAVGTDGLLPQAYGRRPPRSDAAAHRYHLTPRTASLAGRARTSGCAADSPKATWRAGVCRKQAPARLPLLGGGQPGGFAHTGCRYSGQSGGTTTPAAPSSRWTQADTRPIPAAVERNQPRGVEAAPGPGRYGCRGIQSSRHLCGRHSHRAHRVSHEGDSHAVVTSRPAVLGSTAGRIRYY
jgi:hypothetical protein